MLFLVLGELLLTAVGNPMECRSPIVFDDCSADMRFCRGISQIYDGLLIVECRLAMGIGSHPKHLFPFPCRDGRPVLVRVFCAANHYLPMSTWQPGSTIPQTQSRLRLPLARGAVEGLSPTLLEALDRRALVKPANLWVIVWVSSPIVGGAGARHGAYLKYGTDDAGCRELQREPAAPWETRSAVEGG
jgi:hypothetical protein